MFVDEAEPSDDGGCGHMPALVGHSQVGSWVAWLVRCFCRKFMIQDDLLPGNCDDPVGIRGVGVDFVDWKDEVTRK